MDIFALFALMFPFVGLIMWASKKAADARRQSYQRLAESLGLTFHPGSTMGYPGLAGTYKGEAIEVGVELRGGKNKHPFTWVSCEMVGFPPDISLYPQGFLQGVARMFGVMDIEVDDPVFDDAVVVQGDDIPGLRRVLANPAVRRELVSVFGEYRLATVRGGELRIVQRGFTEKLGELTHDLDRLVVLAKLLQGKERLGSDASGLDLDLDEDLDDAIEPAVRQALLEQRAASRKVAWLESMTKEPEPQVLHVDRDLEPVGMSADGAELYQDLLASLRERAAEEAEPSGAASAAVHGLTRDPSVQPPSLHVDETGRRLPVERAAQPPASPADAAWPSASSAEPSSPAEAAWPSDSSASPAGASWPSGSSAAPAPPSEASWPSSTSSAPAPPSEASWPSGSSASPASPSAAAWPSDSSAAPASPADVAWPSAARAAAEPPATSSSSASRRIALSELEPLAQRGLAGRDLDAALAPILGGELSVTDAEVREVRRSSSFGVSERYRGGQSVVVKLESGVELAFLLPKDDPRAEGLKRGGRFSGSGVATEWERLYRRVLVEG